MSSNFYIFFDVKGLCRSMPRPCLTPQAFSKPSQGDALLIGQENSTLSRRASSNPSRQAGSPHEGRMGVVTASQRAEQVKTALLSVTSLTN